MLNFVLGEVQRSSDSFVCCILSRLDFWLSSSEPDHEGCRSESSLLFLSHSLIFHLIYIITAVLSRVYFVIRALMLLVSRDQSRGKLKWHWLTCSQVITVMFKVDQSVYDSLKNLFGSLFSIFVVEKIVIIKSLCRVMFPIVCSLYYAKLIFIFWHQSWLEMGLVFERSNFCLKTHQYNKNLLF